MTRAGAAVPLIWVLLRVILMSAMPEITDGDIKPTDGGKTWDQVYSHNNPDGSYSISGLNVTTCYGVHFDPFDRNHFFICYTDMGLFHTFNGGNKLVPFNNKVFPGNGKIPVTRLPLILM